MNCNGSQCLPRTQQYHRKVNCLSCTRNVLSSKAYLISALCLFRNKPCRNIWCTCTWLRMWKHEACTSMAWSIDIAHIGVYTHIFMIKEYIFTCRNYALFVFYCPQQHVKSMEIQSKKMKLFFEYGVQFAVLMKLEYWQNRWKRDCNGALI